MGSFQQVIMGGTCLVAAFLFGSYLHNRPAGQQSSADETAVLADPLESFLSSGSTRPARSTAAPARQPENQSPAAPAASWPSVENRRSVLNAGSASQPQSTSRNDRSGDSLSLVAMQDANNDVQAVVPDFSELASRFRNSPLELDSRSTGPSTPTARDAVHASERIPDRDSVTQSPALVIRQPESSASGNNNAGFELDSSYAADEAATDSRWRVNRSDMLDRFRVSGNAPEPDEGSSETIEDVLSKRSADYLREPGEPQPQQKLMPRPEENLITSQRKQVLERAARRSQDILDIDDPRNRFKSVLQRDDSFAPPAPDTGDYFRGEMPAAPARRVPIRQYGTLRPIQRFDAGNGWSRQSNIQPGMNSAETHFASVYTVEPGDTLQSISQRFYGTSDHYLKIYKANRGILQRLTSMPVGVEIGIPQLNN